MQSIILFSSKCLFWKCENRENQDFLQIIFNSFECFSAFHMNDKFFAYITIWTYILVLIIDEEIHSNNKGKDVTVKQR